MSSYTFDLPPHDAPGDFTAAPLPFSHELDSAESRHHEQDMRTITLRMPGTLLNRLDSLASNAGTSRSHTLRQITALVLDSLKNDPDIGDYNAQVTRLYQRAREVVLNEGYVSAGLLQRHLRIDYHIALLLIDELEKNYTVTPPDEEGRRILTLRKKIASAESDPWYGRGHLGPRP